MHILKKNNRNADYLVGSLLPGFDRMVRLSDAPLMVIEGDEYLTSPIDRTPKFWHYKPHFSMITGIAWDHINVFPTFENYIEQFKIYLNTISEGYFFYGNDEHLQQLSLEHPGISHPYLAPTYTSTENGVEMSFENEKITLNIFGKHNIENAAGVVELAVKIGISRLDAWKSLSDFPGTAKRLEKVYETENMLVIRDFAHAPSKVKASVSAVREQYPGRNFLAVFELHTFSSLMPEFMVQYHQTMSEADKVFVLFDPHVFELKRMPVPSAETIQQRMGDVSVYSNIQTLQTEVKKSIQGSKKNVILLMSSGNLGGSKIEDFIE
jgi:UDP-N-acetylmuramate: L-alanyl-gamma-D-glutamyl-meso-diaminopimelate ligase